VRHASISQPRFPRVGRAIKADEGQTSSCAAERVAEADRSHETRRRADAHNGGLRRSPPFRGLATNCLVLLEETSTGTLISA
jgi:hypothetical protein